MKDTQDCHGFTLLELIVVLFLISLSVGLVTINLVGRLPSIELKSETRKLSSTIKYAKSLSQLKDSVQSIVIDLDEKKYMLKGAGKKRKELPREIHMKAEISEDVMAEEGRWEIRFFPEGGVETDINAVILGNKNKDFRVEIDPVVGSSIVE